MRRGFRTAWILALLTAGGLAACTDGGNSAQGDVRSGDDLRADVSGDVAGDGENAGGRDGANGTDDRTPGDAIGQGDDAAGVPDADGDPAGDAPAPDDAAGIDPGPMMDSFCRSFEDCADDEVCEFSLGACQKRGTWTDTATALYGFHPAAAAPGDLLVVDGTVLCASGMMGCTGGRLRIGSVSLGGYTLPTDENRMIVTVTAAMKGTVSAYDSAGKPVSLPVPFGQAPAGVIACDGGTPMASGIPGATPGHVGPYAAGYVDLGDDLGTRVFYPALCGSIRRPAAPGTWPLVMIMHGNGALYLNHEHLAQLLATWGFVSVMPETNTALAGDEQGAQELVRMALPLVQRVRGRSLAGEHAVLAGVSTTEDVFWVGHSRGTGRSEELIDADADVAAHTRGVIFLGPVDDGLPVPGLLLVFGAGHDAQSGSGSYHAPYDGHDGTKWLVEIPGGNHGSFCDHKVYGYGSLGSLFGDGKPDITRHQQLRIVETFGVPLVQRAFGVDEPFAAILDSPPSDPLYTVHHED